LVPFSRGSFSPIVSPARYCNHTFPSALLAPFFIGLIRVYPLGSCGQVASRYLLYPYHLSPFIVKFPSPYCTISPPFPLNFFLSFANFFVLDYSSAPGIVLSPSFPFSVGGKFPNVYPLSLPRHGFAPGFRDFFSMRRKMRVLLMKPLLPPSIFVERFYLPLILIFRNPPF